MHFKLFIVICCKRRFLCLPFWIFTFMETCFNYTQYSRNTSVHKHQFSSSIRHFSCFPSATCWSSSAWGSIIVAFLQVKIRRSSLMDVLSVGTLPKSENSGNVPSGSESLSLPEMTSIFGRKT